jgi:hypothetical protein
MVEAETEGKGTSLTQRKNLAIYGKRVVRAALGHMRSNLKDSGKSRKIVKAAHLSTRRTKPRKEKAP